jgi:hypothetical protein
VLLVTIPYVCAEKCGDYHQESAVEGPGLCGSSESESGGAEDGGDNDRYLGDGE